MPGPLKGCSTPHAALDTPQRLPYTCPGAHIVGGAGSGARRRQWHRAQGGLAPMSRFFRFQVDAPALTDALFAFVADPRAS